MTTRVRLLTLVAALSFAAVAPSRAGVTLYAGMEGTWDGAGPRAGRAAAEGGTPRFVEGRRGQAILTGAECGHLVYPNRGALVPECGSVEFWICPEDWEGLKDEEFHWWFIAQGRPDRGWLTLYKYYQRSALVFFLTGSAQGSYTTVGHMIHDWKPGAWHHLVGTWSPMGSAIYADGKLSGSTSELQFPRTLPDRFHLGDTAAQARSRIDEFYLYDRPLTLEEVAWAFAHATDRPAGADVPADQVRTRLKVNVKSSPARGTARVQMLVLGAEAPADLRGRVAVAARQGSASAEVVLAGRRFAECTLPIRRLAAGRHMVSVVLQAGGRPFATAAPSLDWPGEPVWRGTGVGLKPDVPRGFEPVRVHGRHVRCIGRDYELGELGLPAQVISARQPLLAAPVRLEFITDRGASRPSGDRGKLAVRGVRNDRAAIVASSASAGLAMETAGELYFDGLLRCTLTLRPRGATRLERAVLRIPLRPAVAELFHYAFRDPAFGGVPAGSGAVLSGPFTPFVWVGNNDGGLMFLCESDEPFRPADPARLIRIVRTEGSVVLEVAFVERPFPLSKPWKVTFGLQASPVKPLPKGFRRWTIATGSRPRVTTLWPTPDMLRYYGYPEAGSKPAKLRELIWRTHRAGTLLIPYVHPNMLSGASPEWRQFGQDWILPGYLDAMCADVTAYGAPFFGVSTGSADWRDFITWKTDRFLRRWDLDGLYYDHTMPFACKNPLSGEGYLRDGTLHPTYNIFSKRELYRRLYNVVKSLGKETFIFAHTADSVPLPYLSFCDGFVNGEGLGRTLKDNYLELHDLDYYRAAFVGYQWGCIPYWLDEITGEFARDRRAFAHWTGLCLLLDCNTWPVVGYADETHAIVEALKPYGWQNATFLPFWRNHQTIAGQSQAVRASAYRTPKGTILVVLNLTRAPQQATLRVTAARLGLRPGFRARDIRSREAVPVSDGVLPLELEGMGLRLIYLW